MSAIPSLPEFPRTGNSPATGPKVNPVRPMRVLRQHLWVVMVSIVMFTSPEWHKFESHIPGHVGLPLRRLAITTTAAVLMMEKCDYR